MAVEVFDSKDALIAAAAAYVARAATAAISARGVFTLALTGGSVAKDVHPAMAASAIDWTKTRIFFGDERCVAPSHEDSNYRLARETLLDPARVPEANVFRMRGESDDAIAAARAYEEMLPAALDLVMLGMGPDGHVCSLFPGFAQLTENARRVVAVEGSPKPPPRRITVTPVVLERARAIVTIAMSADKADAVARALAPAGNVADTPARLARERDWMLTREAGAKLPRA